MVFIGQADKRHVGAGLPQVRQVGVGAGPPVGQGGVFRHALYEGDDPWPEGGGHLVEAVGVGAVFHDVVQQAGDENILVTGVFRCDEHNGNHVGDVGFRAAFPVVAVVGCGGLCDGLLQSWGQGNAHGR